MTVLLHFEDKVHRKGLVLAEGLPLLRGGSGPRASGISGGALHREEDQMPSGHVHGAILDHADLFPPPAVGPGGGTG